MKVQLCAAVAVLALVPAIAMAQTPRPGMSSDGRPVLDPVRGSVFACDSGGEIQAQFVTRKGELVAIVNSGAGEPVVLPLRPWTGGPAQITWSDGQRTLTWSPSVQIHWMNGSDHRMCGRGAHKH